MLKGFIRKFRPFELLEEGQVEAIWEGIFEVLESTGLQFETPEALKIFDKGGCVVDHNRGNVRFPHDLVEECIRSCPGSFEVEARDPNNNLLIRDDALYIQPGPGMQYLDLNTYEPREATRKEFYDAVTIYDALPNLHYHHNNGPMFSFEGIQPFMAPVESYAARARNSTKVNYMVHGFENEIFNIEIAAVVGAKGFFGAGASSPLTWSNDSVRALIRAIKAGIPLSIASGAVWGGTSPATMAGEIVANSVEVIGPLVLAQLISPGHPYRAGTFTFPQNMRTGAPFFANITTALADTAFHQVWRKYGTPTHNVEAGIPNSKCMDFQAGYEKGMNALAQAMSGARSIWIHGAVYGELTAHPVQAILDDDIAGMVGRFLEGIQVDSETLAIELIKEVGPMPGHYLNKAHTRKWWSKEQFTPSVADILTLPEWLKSGKATCLDNAKRKMEEILATHKVSISLTASQEEDIERILADARRHFQGKS